MIFYLGAPKHWLGELKVPLFVSRRHGARGAGDAGWLHPDKPRRGKLPKAKAPWAIDSGGYSELTQYGQWELDPFDYVAEVRHAAKEIGKLQWAACMDWMCEPHVLYDSMGKGRLFENKEKAPGTFLSIEEHQYRTIDNYCRLRELGGRELAHLWAPVLQGWCLEDYIEHVHLWQSYGRVDLMDVPVVGLGSICRRQGTDMFAALVDVIFKAFWAPASGKFIRLHAFGAKKTGLPSGATVRLLEHRIGARIRHPKKYADVLRWARDALPQDILTQATAAAAGIEGSSWEESRPEVCRLLASADSHAWSKEASYHAQDVWKARDDLAVEKHGMPKRRKNELPYWGLVVKKGGVYLHVGGEYEWPQGHEGNPRYWRYKGGKEVGRIRPERAGEIHHLAPSQMFSACAREYRPAPRKVGGSWQPHRGHKADNNCMKAALAWRKGILGRLPEICQSTTPIFPPSEVKKLQTKPMCAADWRRKGDPFEGLLPLPHVPLPSQPLRMGEYDPWAREYTGRGKKRKPPKEWWDRCRVIGTGDWRLGEWGRPPAPAGSGPLPPYPPALPSPWRPEEETQAMAATPPTPRRRRTAPKPRPKPKPKPKPKRVAAARAKPKPRRRKRAKPKEPEATPAKKGQTWAAISYQGVIQGKVQRVEGPNVVIGGVLGRAFRRLK